MEAPQIKLSTTTLSAGTTLFKYIVKEKSKSVIVITDSDDEDNSTPSCSTSSSSTSVPTAAHKPIAPNPSATKTSAVNLFTPKTIKPPVNEIRTKAKKRKLSNDLIYGNAEDPIPLDDSDDESNNTSDLFKDDFASEREVIKNEGGKQADKDCDINAVDTNKLLSDLSDMGALAISSSTSISPQQKMEPLQEHIVENVKEIMKETVPKDITQPTVQQDQYHVETKSTSTSMEIDSCSDFDLNVGETDIVFSPLSEYTNSSDSEVSSMKYITGMDYEMLEQPPAPSTVNTITTTENASLLRYLELYIQSISNPAVIHNDSRSSRRATRFVETSDNSTGPISPYVPNQVWYNSTWEDWAQLDVGDVLHCPFTKEETLVMKTQVEKQNQKKLKSRAERTDFWQYVSTLLPGRTPLECMCFWQDFMNGNNLLFSKTIIITKQKHQKRNNSRHQLLSKRSRTGNISYNSLRMVHLASMSRESIISDGSGDALTLAIFNDPVCGVRVAVGSLCDENTQYNMPGNLRLWSSDTANCLSLRGHKTANEESGQDIWRTVTDVKMSKDHSLIYSASHDGCANVWRASNGKLVSTLQYHCKPINQLAVNYSAAENNVLATCSNDGTATIWSVSANGKTGSGMICELDTRFYTDPHVDCIEFGHDASDDMLFLGINNQDLEHPGYIEVFDAVKGASKIRFDTMKGCVSTLAVSSSGRFIVSGNYNRYDHMSGDGFLHLHDIKSPKTANKFYTGHPDVNTVAISACERYVASGNADKEKGEVLVFDVRNHSKFLHKLSHDQTKVNQSLIAPDSSVGIGGLYWTSDSRTILTGGGDSTVKVWGIEGATRLLRSYQTSNCVTSLTVHEETMTIAAGVAGAQGIVHVWRP